MGKVKKQFSYHCQKSRFDESDNKTYLLALYQSYKFLLNLYKSNTKQHCKKANFMLLENVSIKNNTEKKIPKLLDSRRLQKYSSEKNIQTKIINRC